MAESLLERSPLVGIFLGLEDVGDSSPVLGVEHLQAGGQVAVALQASADRSLLGVVEELGVGQQSEVVNLPAGGVEVVLARLPSQRHVVVDDRRQPEGVIRAQQPPPPRLDLVLPRLLAERTPHEDVLQLPRRDCAEVLQR